MINDNDSSRLHYIHTACGLVVHKHCQDRAPVCEHAPGQLIRMASEKVVKTLDDLDDLAQFLVEKACTSDSYV